MLRVLRALRPFLSLGWLLVAAIPVGVLVTQADLLRVVLSERQASSLSCDEWSRMTPRPAWVHLHECRLLAGQRVEVHPFGSWLKPHQLLVPLGPDHDMALPLAYALLPRDFDQDPARLSSRGFDGVARPLGDDYLVSAAYDERLPVLRLDEPGGLPLLVVIGTALPLVFMWRRLQRSLREVDASDRIADHARSAPPSRALAIDISPLLELRRAILVSTPSWGGLVVWLVVAAPFGAGPFAREAAVGVAVAILGAGLYLWQRARPSRVAFIAGFGPLGVFALGIAGIFGMLGPAERWASVVPLVYGAFATGLLVRTCWRLRREPACSTLLEIESEWLDTRRKTRIRLRVGKARGRYLGLHAVGVVLAAVVGPILAFAGLGGFGMGIGIGIFFIFRAWARRHAMPTAAEALADDARTPVLYLRSFGDEHLLMQSRSFRIDPSISEWVAAQFSLIGPVIAIARPSQDLPDVGPYRIEFPAQRDWQSEVCERIDRSAAIVLAFGVTQGVLWELGQIAKRQALPRTCFVFPPLPAMNLERRWQQIDEHAAVVPQLRALSSLDPRQLIMAWVGLDGELVVICSTIRVKVSYEMAFAAVRLRGVLSTASPSPR